MNEDRVICAAHNAGGIVLGRTPRADRYGRWEMPSGAIRAAVRVFGTRTGGILADPVERGTVRTPAGRIHVVTGRVIRWDGEGQEALHHTAVLPEEIDRLIEDEPTLAAWAMLR